MSEELVILNVSEETENLDRVETQELIGLMKQTMVEIQSNFLDENNKIDYKKLVTSELYKVFLRLFFCCLFKDTDSKPNCQLYDFRNIFNSPDSLPLLT